MSNRGKRSKTLCEVKPVKNISKNPEFSRDKSCAKRSPSLHKLKDHECEWQNPFGLKDKKPKSTEVSFYIFFWRGKVPFYISAGHCLQFLK